MPSSNLILELPHPRELYAPGLLEKETVMKRSFALLSLLMPSATQAAVVINPVPTPIALGARVGLTFVGQVPASGDPAVNGFRFRLQSLRTVPDGSGRLFAHDTRGTITVVGRDSGASRTWFDIRAALPGFSNASNPGQTGLMSFAFHPNLAGDAARLRRLPNGRYKPADRPRDAVGQRLRCRSRQCAS